jgi:citrate lyase synthetase
MSIIFAFYVSMACNLAVLGLFLYTRGRVAKFFERTQALDWQSVADITGDIGALKRSIQRLNNRLNGMEKTAQSPDALAELALIHKQNQNVTPIQAAPPRATGG